MPPFSGAFSSSSLHSQGAAGSKGPVVECGAPLTLKHHHSCAVATAHAGAQRWSLQSPLLERLSFLSGGRSSVKSNAPATPLHLLFRLLLLFLLLSFVVTAICSFRDARLESLRFPDALVLMRRGDTRVVLRFGRRMQEVYDPAADLSHPRLAARREITRFLELPQERQL